MSGVYFINTVYSKHSLDSVTPSKPEMGAYNSGDNHLSQRSNVSIQRGATVLEDRSEGCSKCRSENGERKEEEIEAKEMLKSYVESATIHGVSQTNGPEHYPYRRRIWLVLVLLMAIILGYILYKQIALRYEYPIKTTTKVSLHSELPFPAITICNINQFMRDKVPDIPIVKHVLFYFSEYAKMAFGDYKHNMPDLDNLTDVSGEELKRILLDATPRLSDFFHQCRWETKIYNCEDLFRPINTTYGSCFVFNGPEVKPENMAKAVGSVSSLRVLIHLSNNKSYYSRLIHAGAKVIVHEPYQMPYPETDGFSLRPGLSATIAISRSESKSLPRPYKAYSNGYCEDTQAEGYANKLSEYQTYTTIHCLAECQLNRTREICGCQYYFSPGDFPVCSAKLTLTCLLPLFWSVRTDDFMTCDCPRECETVAYSADVSYADFASQFIEEQAARDSVTLFQEKLRENIVDVLVSFKTLNVFHVIQEPELTRTTIIGTLGGQMGLFLGASILSLTELLEILILLMLRAFKTCAAWIAGRCCVRA
ncbi:acid-sensing ion channel 1-like [Plakobranchus ocellatus]|uniref:Acid-sensing ion channel 1-like n=1 Tax=Plakobranchus ocellatus TaxID=259542 RepID=A0AAV3ZJ89_9GAST|nr:acid-sensing ion channel 1-like [Plakobranchus ocellatus]